MSVMGEGLDQSFQANGSLATRQFTFVSIDTNGDVGDGGAGDFSVGILQNKPAAAGRPASVRISGTSKLKIADTVNEGDLLKADTDGAGVPSTADRENVVARALEAGASGAYIMVEILKFQSSHA